MRLIASAGATTITKTVFNFNLVIKPDCTKDVVTFNVPENDPPRTYWIKQDVADVMTINPGLVHTIPECPMKCTLLEDLQIWDVRNPSRVVTSF